jgi:hypothetical protein
MAGPVDSEAAWAQIEQRAGQRRLIVGLRDRATSWVVGLRLGSGLHAAAFAFAAAILAVGVALGSFEIIKHLGGGEPTIVITDDTVGMSPGGATGQTVQTTQTPAASEGTWQHVPLSMEGGSVNTLVMSPADPAVLYEGTDEGLFKSTDGGGSWTRLPVTGRVIAIAVDPGAPSTVYATSNWVQFKSLDGGATWTQIVDSSMYPPAYKQFWIDSSTSPATLYGQEGYGYGPYKSTDGGITWQDVRTPEGHFTSLAIDPSGHGLFATYPGATGAMLARSFDGGSTWADVTASLPASVAPGGANATSGDTYAYAVAMVDPRDSSRLYLYDLRITASAAGESMVVASVFVSSDLAETWSALTGAELSWAKALLNAAPGTPAGAIESAKTFLAGFAGAVTDTDGVAHQGVGPVSTWDARVVVDPDDPFVLYLPTKEGCYKSTDGGVTWGRSGMKGMVVTGAGTIIVDPDAPSTIYATTSAGIAKSLDGGTNWSTILEVDGGGSSLALAPSSPSTLYVWSPLGLERSDDGGVTWTRRRGAGLPDLGSDWWWFPQPFTGLLVASDAPDTVYAIQSVETIAGLCRSTDGGDTWSTVGGLPVGAVVSVVEAPGDPGTLYAGTDGNGVFKSTDSGRTWTPAGDPSRGAAPPGRVSLTVSPSDPATIWALPDGSTSVWHSADGGVTWTKVVVNANEKLLGLRISASTSPSPPVLYAATYTDSDEGTGQPTIWHPSIYRSLDGGGTWKIFTAGFPAGWGSAISDPAPDGTRYVDTEQGLYKWTPGR